MIVLDREAPRTAYLLDADEAGKRLRKMLRGVGVASKMIFQIPDSQQRGLVVEDLIDTEVYARAVNEELHRSHGPAYTFPEDTLPAVGRPTAVQTWCNENRIKPPKKTAVAYRVLEEGIGQSFLAEHYHKPIRQLFAGISTALQG